MPTPLCRTGGEKITGKSHRKRLGEKQKLIYAPMSDVGGVLVDRERGVDVLHEAVATFKLAS